jgi:hypothetical protein
MTLDEARAEGQRWLDYLDREKQKSIEIQKLAADRRQGKCDADEGRRRLRAIDDRSNLVVYDGAKLAEAVALLIRT